MICTLKHLRILLVEGGIEHTFACDSEGIESGEPLSSKDTMAEVFDVVVRLQDERKYLCTNCHQLFNGEDEFTARQHLGKFNQRIGNVGR